MTPPTPPRTARRWPAVTVLAAFALLLAACSGGGKPAASKQTHKTTTTTAAAPSPTTSAPTTTTPGGPVGPPCTASQLTGSEVAFGVGAGGGSTTVVLVTNTSAKACSLDGYPGIQLITATGVDAPTTLDQGGSGIPSAIATPGVVSMPARTGQASFLLYWVAVPTANQGNCTLQPKMKVSVPGSKTTFTTAAEINACGGVVQASPFRPGLVQA